MKKILLITFSSLKKKKANAVVLLFLVALAVMLLHISLSALTYSNTLTKNKIAKANSPDVVVVGTNLENNLDSNLINIDGYVSHKSEKAIVATDAIILKGEEKETMMSIFYNYDSPRNMQIPYLIDAGNEIKANSIVVPYYLHLAEGYNIGDNITLSSSSGNFEYVIYGYFEDLYFANPTIITMYKFYLMNGGFTDLTEASEIPGSTLTNVDTYKIDISTNAGKFENELSQFFTSHMYIFLSVDVDLISVAGTAIVSILLAIILLFAVIIIVVSFVVIRFTINSHIGNNIICNCWNHHLLVIQADN